MIKRSLWGLLFAFCFLIVETALLSNILVLPVVPDLLLLLLVFISFYNGRSTRIFCWLHAGFSFGITAWIKFFNARNNRLYVRAF